MSAAPRLPAVLVDAVAARYRPAGRFAFHFARGKLAGDPVFAGLLAGGLLAADSARGRGLDIVDLGCGQALLAALRRPYEAVAGAGKYAEPAAREVTARYRTFCGT